MSSDRRRWGTWQRAGMIRPVKAREDRQKVMITARMRCGGSWSDICVLNLSRRGLGIQAPDPPPRGSYVEVCRGPVIVVARVMWAKGHRAGLYSQDPIWIEGLLSEQKPAKDCQTPAGGALIERRRVPRMGERHELSRTAGRAMEFTFIALAAAGMAAMAFGIVEQALAEPLSQIGAALNGQRH